MPKSTSNGVSLHGVIHILGGTGAPEGAVMAPPGSVYLRSDGATYRKASGTGNAGWKLEASDTYAKVIPITQVAYNALATPRDSGVLYVITG